jgi:hypothetical protein
MVAPGARGGISLPVEVQRRFLLLPGAASSVLKTARMLLIGGSEAAVTEVLCLSSAIGLAVILSQWYVAMSE